MSEKDYITIKIKVQPRASRSEIVGWHGDSIRVRLAAVPVDGKANIELVELLSKNLGVKKSDIDIISGEFAKTKLLRIKGIKDLNSLNIKPS